MFPCRDIELGKACWLVIRWRSVIWVIGGLVPLIGGRIKHRSCVRAAATTRAAAATGAASDATENGEAEDKDCDDDADYGGPSGNNVSDGVVDGGWVGFYILAVGFGHAIAPA